MDEGFRDWILTGSYLPNIQDDPSMIVLDIVDLAKLIRYIAFDFERFSLSSVESYAVAYIERDMYKLAGWPLVKLYYSAFFSAHAIMRSQGGGVIRLEKSQTQYLNSIISIICPEAVGINPGDYQYEVSTAKETGRLSVNLKPVQQNRGVHEGFWKMFCQFMDEASKGSSQNNSANALEFVVGVEEIRSAIMTSGASSSVWFSAVRNEINYQHKHNVWFPLPKSAKGIIALNKNKSAVSSGIPLTISKSKDPLSAFANLSAFLALVNIELANVVANRSVSGRSFGQKWRRISESLDVT